MAEQPDRDSKTEQATPRRIEEALKKGNTPFSRDIGPAVLIIAIGICTPISATYISSRLVPGLTLLLDRPSEFRLGTAEEAVFLLSSVGLLFMAAVGPMLLGLLVVALVATGSQNTPRLVLHRIKPEFSRISIAKGWQRIFGKVGFVEFAKSTVKLLIFCYVLYLATSGSYERILRSILSSPSELPSQLMRELSVVLLVTGVCIVVLAMADVIWSRFKWQLDLRMSQQELKEEQKQSEGDPIVRARQRSLARDRARRRMISSVPRATLVIANPTHYAVALRYVQGESAAPVVIAKGVDHLALRIRAIAEQHQIPVIEDRALARSLYDVVKADRPIPPEFYRAVAEIILFLMSRSGTQSKPK